MKKLMNIKVKVLVMGFGISGINAAHLLVKLGANVTANDKATPKNNDIVDDLEADGIKVITGDNPISLANEGFDVVVKILEFLMIIH